MVRSFKEYLGLPDFEGTVVKHVAIGSYKSVHYWQDGMELSMDDVGSCDVVLEPIKWYSFRLHSMIPEDMRDREVKVAAGELAKTMVEFLKEVVLDWIAAVCFEKQFHDLSLFIVAYEVKWLDLKYVRFLKDIPGFSFGWLYGGLLTLDHLRG